jgi:hypothetical protein
VYIGDFEGLQGELGVVELRIPVPVMGHSAAEKEHVPVSFRSNLKIQGDSESAMLLSSVEISYVSYFLPGADIPPLYS